MVPIIVALVILAASGVSAPVEFQQVIGGPGLDRGISVTPTRDGGYIAVGLTASEGAGGEDVYLVKTDPAGQIEWSRTYGGPDEDNGWVVREIADGYVVAGYTKSFGAGGSDMYLLTTDADGEPRWFRTFGGPADDVCWNLLLTEDGGYALVGETASETSGSEDGFLVKTDAAGEEEWSRTYGGDAGDRLFAIESTDEGGFLLVGQTYSEGAGDRDAYVIKTDAQGHAEWSRTFGGPAKDVGHGVDRTADGHFLITGYTVSFSSGGDDPYIIKIDAKGDTLWTRTIALEGVNRALTGVQAADGGFYLVGFSNLPLKGRGAALLVRTDQGGNLEWAREILPTSSGQSFGYTVRATPDGGCVFTGHTTVRSAGHLDLLLVKVGGETR